MSELRNCFDRTLNTKGICPENSLYFVACGAALCAEKTIDFYKVIEEVKITVEAATLPLTLRFSKTKKITKIL